MKEERNIDAKTVDGFGAEWSRFDQSDVDEGELRRVFDAYFRVFPWELVAPNAEGFDVGCGTGRWARFVAPRIRHLHCIDASPKVVEVAKRTLSDHENCSFHVASVEAMPLADSSMDFGYSIGVLHHVPDTLGAVAACVAKLKPGAPFLCYLYYRFDNRPAAYRVLWMVSDWIRRLVSRSPQKIRFAVAEVAAVIVYVPLARAARLLEQRGRSVASFPLSSYRNASYYTMRTDALDRFGTRLERRFTAREIRAMMTHAGLVDIRFSEEPPFWCVVGRKA